MTEKPRPIHEKIITSKIAWITAFLLGATISAAFDVEIVSQALGSISGLGLLACVDGWQKDPKGWAIVFLVGILIGVEFGGLHVFRS